MPAARARTAGGWRLEVAVVLGLVVLLGLLVAPLPFTGDQALFAAGARQLADGDVLYRDFWDVKQPGIYAFYLAGGSLLGYSEVALHLAELAFQLAFAVVLIVTLRDRYTHRFVGPIVALLIVGTYYAAIEPLQLGQVESLVGFPTYVTLWAAARGCDDPAHRTRWFVTSGIAGGLVLVLKLVLAPILAGIWLVALWSVARRRDGRTEGSLLGAVGALALGVAIPVGAVVTYLAAYGQLETARWTFLDVSSQATGIAGRPVSRLTEGVARTAARWALPLAFAAGGLYAIARRGRDRFDLMVLAWLVLGIPVFLVQHWWIYTLAMFLVPVGLLAGRGLDLLAGDWRALGGPGRLLVLAACAVLLVPAGVRVARNLDAVATHGFALSTADRADLRADLEPEYRNARAWADRVHRDDRPDVGVFVLGNPLDLYLADRPQTVSINGWSPEQYPEDVWARLRRELSRARPTELVVDRFSRDIMRDRSPATDRLIRRLYAPYGGAGDDTWLHPR
jgi:hypothetical protein